MKRNILWLFLLTYFVISHASDATSADPNSLKIVEVAEGLFVHQGKHVGFEHEDVDDIANIGFIIGEKCIAVIDTGGSINIASRLKAAITKTSNKPICYVINTHIHFDHVLGNVVFKQEGTQFVGHKDLRDSLEYNTEFFLEQYKRFLGDNATADSIVKPDIDVEKNLELDLGDRTLLLTAYPSAHSDTDLTVFDKKTGTAWLADLLFMQRIPAIDGSLRGWLNVNDELLQQDFKQVIPGHGPASAKWPDAIQAQQRYLQLIHDEVSAKIDEGAFMEEVIDSVGAEEKKQWLLHEENHRRNVSKAFTELEW